MRSVATLQLHTTNYMYVCRSNHLQTFRKITYVKLYKYTKSKSFLRAPKKSQITCQCYSVVYEPFVYVRLSHVGTKVFQVCRPAQLASQTRRFESREVKSFYK